MMVEPVMLPENTALPVVELIANVALSAEPFESVTPAVVVFATVKDVLATTEVMTNVPLYPLGANPLTVTL